MKNILGVLKEHSENSWKVIEESMRQAHILCPKEEIKKVILVITKTLQMRLVFLFASDDRKERGYRSLGQ